MNHSQDFISLTLWNPSDNGILGELTEGRLTSQDGSNGTNYLISGLAGDGTLDTLERFIGNGFDTVDYVLAGKEGKVRGQAMLLQPSKDRQHAGTEITMETPNPPQPA